MFSSKKGESLVEVVVSLGIMAMVFAGVVNIVVAAVTLNLSSRQRLEVIATVQKNLNEWLAADSLNNSCPVTPRPLAQTITLTGCAATPPHVTAATPRCYWLERSDLVSAEAPSSMTLPDANTTFIKITSHGAWYTRMIGESEFEVSEIIRRSQ